MTGAAAMHAGDLRRLEEYICRETINRIAADRPDLAFRVAQAIQAIESGHDSVAVLTRLGRTCPTSDWLVAEACLLEIISELAGKDNLPA